MWRIDELTNLGVDFYPNNNSFTYTFPPPYFCKANGIKKSMASGFDELLLQDATLYIHIPFCQMDCSFCSLHREILLNQSDLDDYLEALKKEINIVGKKLATTPIRAVYFGGGTPSILSDFQITSLLDSIENNFNLVDSEICIECAPSVNRDFEGWLSYFDKLLSRKTNPLSRVSLGIQSFNDGLAKKIGRNGGYITSRHLLLAVDKVLPTYNIDLIFGFLKSGKSEEFVLKNISEEIVRHRLEGFNLPSLSLYQLWDTESIRLTNSIANLLESNSLVEQKWDLQSKLFDLGYEPSIVSTLTSNCDYEHKWMKSRHTGFRNIGLGSGAYSILPNEFSLRPRNIVDYISTLNGNIPDMLDTRYRLTTNELIVREIVMGLRTFQWIDFSNVEAEGLNSQVIKDLEGKILNLVALSIIEKSDKGIRLNKQSFMIANEISSYLHPNSQSRKRI